MDIFKWIDAQILRFFQFISDCVAAFSDDKVNNFVLAQMCLIIVIIFDVELLIIKNIISHVNILSLVAFGSVSVFIYLIMIGVICAGKNSCSAQKFGFKNILVSNFFTPRIINMFLIPWVLRDDILYLTYMGPCPDEFQDVLDHLKHLASMSNVIHMSSFLFFLYFVSCTPKPPSKNKVKKWLDKLFAPKEIHA